MIVPILLLVSTLSSLLGRKCQAFQTPTIQPLRTESFSQKSRYSLSSSRIECQATGEEEEDGVVVVHRHHHTTCGHHDSTSNNKRGLAVLRRILDTTADLPSPQVVQTSGLFGPIKKVHNPVTYILLGLAAGFRFNWCFRSPLYWFVMAFTVKWYRARYIFKIPVWDRQPNWNNVITSKEQEKDLKALTCKNCGSTIFIAKSREFFFEGTTGIAGLGCFACGAKGKDNFVMDRDRIVEDVGDMDDYFEYERPLDLISRVERKKLMKEAKGDEEMANRLLMEKTGAVDAEIVSSVTDTESKVNGDAIVEEEPSIDVPETDVTSNDAGAVPSTKASSEDSGQPTTPPKKKKKGSTILETKPIERKSPLATSGKKKKSKKPKLEKSNSDDDLDILDMDAW